MFLPQIYHASCTFVVVLALHHTRSGNIGAGSSKSTTSSRSLSRCLPGCCSSQTCPCRSSIAFPNALVHPDFIAKTMIRTYIKCTSSALLGELLASTQIPCLLGYLEVRSWARTEDMGLHLKVRAVGCGTEWVWLGRGLTNLGIKVNNYGSGH